MLDMNAHSREQMNKTVNTPKIFINFICILLITYKTDYLSRTQPSYAGIVWAVINNFKQSSRN